MIDWQVLSLNNRQNPWHTGKLINNREGMKNENTEIRN